MKKIIIDTNFLMIPYKFRVDIFSEFSRICNFNYEMFIFEESINEFKKIMENQRGINKKAAQFALKLIKLKNIGIIKSNEKDVDNSILNNINEDDIIATLDIALKQKLLRKGVSVIMLRQKKYLQFVEKAL